MGYLGGDGGLGVLNTNELTGGWLRGVAAGRGCGRIGDARMREWRAGCGRIERNNYLTDPSFP